MASGGKQRKSCSQGQGGRLLRSSACRAVRSFVCGFEHQAAPFAEDPISIIGRCGCRVNEGAAVVCLAGNSFLDAFPGRSCVAMHLYLLGFDTFNGAQRPKRNNHLGEECVRTEIEPRPPDRQKVYSG
jgi:hypothetical protein